MAMPQTATTHPTTESVSASPEDPGQPTNAGMAANQNQYAIVGQNLPMMVMNTQPSMIGDGALGLQLPYQPSYYMVSPSQTVGSASAKTTDDAAVQPQETLAVSGRTSAGTNSPGHQQVSNSAGYPEKVVASPTNYVTSSPVGNGQQTGQSHAIYPQLPYLITPPQQSTYIVNSFGQLVPLIQPSLSAPVMAAVTGSPMPPTQPSKIETSTHRSTRSDCTVVEGGLSQEVADATAGTEKGISMDSKSSQAQTFSEEQITSSGEISASVPLAISCEEVCTSDHEVVLKDCFQASDSLDLSVPAVGKGKPDKDSVTSPSHSESETSQPLKANMDTTISLLATNSGKDSVVATTVPDVRISNTPQVPQGIANIPSCASLPQYVQCGNVLLQATYSVVPQFSVMQGGLQHGALKSSVTVVDSNIDGTKKSTASPSGSDNLVDGKQSTISGPLTSVKHANASSDILPESTKVTLSCSETSEACSSSQNTVSFSKSATETASGEDSVLASESAKPSKILTSKDEENEVVKILPNGMIVRSRSSPAKVASVSKKNAQGIGKKSSADKVRKSVSHVSSYSAVTSDNVARITGTVEQCRTSMASTNSQAIGSATALTGTIPAGITVVPQIPQVLTVPPQQHFPYYFMPNSSPITSQSPSVASPLMFVPLARSINPVVTPSAVEKSPSKPILKAKSSKKATVRKNLVKKGGPIVKKEKSQSAKQIPPGKISEKSNNRMARKRKDPCLPSKTASKVDTDLMYSRKSKRIALRKRRTAKKKYEDSCWVTSWPVKISADPKNVAQSESKKSKVSVKGRIFKAKVKEKTVVTSRMKARAPVANLANVTPKLHERNSSLSVSTRSKSKRGTHAKEVKSSNVKLQGSFADQIPGHRRSHRKKLFLDRSRQVQRNTVSHRKEAHVPKLEQGVCATGIEKSRKLQVVLVDLYANEKTSSGNESFASGCCKETNEINSQGVDKNKVIIKSYEVEKNVNNCKPKIPTGKSKRKIFMDACMSEEKNSKSSAIIKEIDSKQKKQLRGSTVLQKVSSDNQSAITDPEKNCTPHCESEEREPQIDTRKRKLHLSEDKMQCPAKKRARKLRKKDNSNICQESTCDSKASTSASVSSSNVVSTVQSLPQDVVRVVGMVSVLPNSETSGTEEQSDVPAASICPVPKRASVSDSSSSDDEQTFQTKDAPSEDEGIPCDEVPEAGLDKTEDSAGSQNKGFSLDLDTDFNGKKQYTLTYMLETYESVSSHEGQELFVCSVCDRHFAKLDNLRAHSESHVDSRCQCILCEATFADVDILMMHLSDHAFLKALQVFQCPACERRFTDSAWFAVHIDMSDCSAKGVTRIEESSGELDGNADKSLTSAAASKNKPELMHRVRKGCRHQVRNQIPWHNEECRPCALCSDVSSSCALLSKHQSSHSNNHAVEDYHFWHYGKAQAECQLCPKSSFTSHTIKVVLNSDYLPGNLVSCDVCQKQFPKSRIAGHKLTAHKSYMCAWCKKVFRNLAGLRYHWRKTCAEKIANEGEEVVNEFSTTIDGHSAVDFKYTLECHKTNDGEKSSFACHYASCQRKFSQATNAEAHAKCHDEKMPYMCELCESAFDKPENFLYHIKDHQTYSRNKMRGGLTVFECLTCERRFIDHKWYVMHKKQVHDISPPKKEITEHPQDGDNVLQVDNNIEVLSSYTPPTPRRMWQPGEVRPCPVCCQALASFQGAKKHLATHNYMATKNIVFHCQCDICGKSFNRRKALGDHMRSRHSNKPRKLREKNIECDICGRKFVFMKDLKLHRRVHTGETPFKCSYCDIAFISNSLRKDHEKRVHKNPAIPLKNFYCRVCGEMCPGLAALRRHQKEAHADSQTFRCLQCQINFTTMSELGCHLQKHKLSGKQSCDICGLQFEKAEFANHKCEPGSFECLKCNIRFGTSVGLKTHDCGNRRESLQQLHDSRKADSKYQCTICSKRFVTSSNLAAHCRVHSEAMLYECSICHLPFKTRGKLEEHTDKHKIWSRRCKCYCCPSHFRNFDTLRAHIRKSHPEIKEIDFKDPSQEVKMLYQCLECSTNFDTYKEVQVHVTEVHEGQEFRDIASEAEVAVRRLKRAPLKKEFMCDLCKSRYPTYNEVVEHMKSHGLEMVASTETNPECMEYTVTMPECQVKDLTEQHESVKQDLTAVTNNTVKPEVKEDILAEDNNQGITRAIEGNVDSNLDAKSSVDIVVPTDDSQAISLSSPVASGSIIPDNAENTDSVGIPCDSCDTEAEQNPMGEGLTVYVISEDGDPEAVLSEDVLGEIRARLEQMGSSTTGENDGNGEEQIVHIIQESAESEQGHVFQVLTGGSEESEMKSHDTPEENMAFTHSKEQVNIEASEHMEQQYEIVYEDTAGETMHVEDAGVDPKEMHHVQHKDVEIASRDVTQENSEPVYQIVHMAAEGSDNLSQGHEQGVVHVESNGVLYAVSAIDSGSEHQEAILGDSNPAPSTGQENVTYYTVSNEPVEQPGSDNHGAETTVAYDHSESDHDDTEMAVFLEVVPEELNHEETEVKSEASAVEASADVTVPLVDSKPEIMYDKQQESEIVQENVGDHVKVDDSVLEHRREDYPASTTMVTLPCSSSAHLVETFSSAVNPANLDHTEQDEDSDPVSVAPMDKDSSNTIDSKADVETDCLSVEVRTGTDSFTLSEDIAKEHILEIPEGSFNAELLLKLAGSQIVVSEEEIGQIKESGEYDVHIIPIDLEKGETHHQDASLIKVLKSTTSGNTIAMKERFEDKWSETPPTKRIHWENTSSKTKDSTTTLASEGDKLTPSVKSEVEENDEGTDSKANIVKDKQLKKKYQCGFCGARFNYAKGVERHFMKCPKKVGHEREPKDYEIDYNFEGQPKICLKFTAETPCGTKALSTREFGCDNCERQFSKEENLKLHENLHKSSHPYLCSFCESAFDVVGHFMQHLDEHQSKCSKVSKRFGVYECHLCERRFTDSTSYRWHVRLKHGIEDKEKQAAVPPDGDETPMVLFGSLKNEREKRKIPWMEGERRSCLFCFEFFSSDGSLKFHIDKSHKPSSNKIVTPCVCDTCGKEFKNRALLWQHKRTHLKLNKPKTHVCDFCGKAFSIRRLLVDHIRTHTGEKPFPCTICGLSFALKSSMKDHMRRIHKNPDEPSKVFKCSVCGFQCGGIAEIRRHHAEAHSEGKTFTCTRCVVEFLTLSDLISHNSEKHWNATKYTCKICGSQYEDQELLSEHECQSVPYSCSYCGVGFSNYKSWQAHEEKHTQPETAESNTSKKYICPVCGFSYANKVSLSCHLRTHNFQKPFSCKLCPFKTAVKSRLARHINKHHAPPKEVQCTLCAKTFRQVVHLHLHMNRVHKKEKKYFNCSLCGKTYDNRSSLFSHLNRKHDGGILRASSCNFCGNTFASATLLKRHIESVHTSNI